MESAAFSIGRHQRPSTIKILSWNAIGIKTKLEKANLQEKLHNYDIVAINEVKTNLNVCLPDYFAYRSTTNQGSSRKGGTVVLIMNWLVDLVSSVDTVIRGVKGQFWHCFSNNFSHM